MFFLFSIPFYLSLLSRHSKLLFVFFFLLLGYVSGIFLMAPYFQYSLFVMLIIVNLPFLSLKEGLCFFLTKAAGFIYT